MIVNHKDNRGMSLVEILLVVAVIGVLAGVGFLSYSTVLNREEKAVFEKLDTELKKTKVETMSRKTVVLELYRNETNRHYYINYSIDGKESEPVRITRRQNITLYYSAYKESTLTEITDIPVKISYKRSSGALEPTLVSGTDKKYIGKITSDNGTGKYSIVFYPQTGKHEFK